MSSHQSPEPTTASKKTLTSTAKLVADAFQDPLAGRDWKGFFLAAQHCHLPSLPALVQHQQLLLSMSCSLTEHDL